LAPRAVIGGRELDQFLADKDAVVKELDVRGCPMRREYGRRSLAKRRGSAQTNVPKLRLGNVPEFAEEQRPLALR
jgi:hypothetical protein